MSRGYIGIRVRLDPRWPRRIIAVRLSDQVPELAVAKGDFLADLGASLG